MLFHLPPSNRERGTHCRTQCPAPLLHSSHMSPSGFLLGTKEGGCSEKDVSAVWFHEGTPHVLWCECAGVCVWCVSVCVCVCVCECVCVCVCGVCVCLWLCV